MDAPEVLGIRGFARLIGRRPSWVTQLRDAGRLVMTPDGTQVRVAESIRRIEETADPSKAAVADRHAAQRGETVPPEPPAGHAPAGGPGEPPDDDSASDMRYTDQRTRREHYQANLAQLDYETRIGKLMAGDEVLAVVASAMAGLRTRLTGLPDVLGPQMAAMSDEGQIRIALADAIEHALAEAARQFQQLAQSDKGD